MRHFFRGATIIWIALRYGLDELVLTSLQKPWLLRVARVLTIGRKLDAPRGQRLREALEQLGPIFVKFGQVLSTRRDLLPPDIANELMYLQDRVPPFDPAVAVATIERAFQKPVDQVFVHFEREPVASASIAQVHFATIRDREGGLREVAVKVLRPGMKDVIEKDLELMRMMAGWVEKLSADGKRLKPRQVVAEFDNYLHDELDLVKEAANAAQLRRNMDGLDLVVMAMVSFGAEVIADGNIHVYAPLRGRAIAGARGNTDARIFCTCMEAQLVSIAGMYRAIETDLPPEMKGKAVQVRLEGEKLLIEPL